MKVLLAVNTLTSINDQIYAAHMNLAYRIGRETQDEFLLFTGRRVSIDRFRNQAAEYALRHDCDYLMFLDDDVAIPRDTYTILKSLDLDIVTPLVYIRGYPFKPMFFKSIELGNETGLTTYDDWEQVQADRLQEYENFKTLDPNGALAFNPHLLEVAAIGFSCCLIKTSVLREVPPHGL